MAKKKRLPSLRFWLGANHLFWRFWPQILVFSALMNILIGGVVIGLRWLTAKLMVEFNVAYLSYTNLGDIIIDHPLMVILLIVMLLLVLLLVYWQFTIFMLFVNELQHDQQPHFRQLMRQSAQRFRQLNGKTFLFLILFFILALPAVSLFFSTPLLSKVVIPNFILTFIEEHTLYAVLLTLFYLGGLWLGLRYLYVLPLLTLNRLSVQQARRQSWQLTRHRNWANFKRGLLATLLGGLIFAIINGLLYFLQVGLDQTQFAFGGAIITMLGLEIASLLLTSYSTIMLLLLMQPPVALAQPPVADTAKHRHFWRVLTWTFLSATVAVLLAFNYGYLKGLLTSNPILISHRGVDAGNGVQNTIPALEKTARKKPAFVEMDVQETKDGQFVVFHDPTLRQLAGRSETPQQLTLAQLQQITVREHGYQAKIPSFDDYLASAIKHQQPLLVELKVTANDSPNFTKNFIHRYYPALKKNHSQIQSLDYRTVEQAKQLAPDLFVDYIMPYNFAFPETKLNGYAMEVTTLNSYFVDKAHAQHQLVYSWDVNDQATLNKMQLYGVDGIITDRFSDMKANLAEQKDQPHYAALINSFTDIAGSVWAE